MLSFIAMLLGASLLLTVPAKGQSLGNVPAAYVPDASYKRMTCEALLQERAQAENNLGTLGAELKAYRSSYFVDFLGLGLPLATIRGNTVAAETRIEKLISHVKGELEAISRATNRRNCRA